MEDILKAIQTAVRMEALEGILERLCSFVCASSGTKYFL
jgi:hypothetical protein